MEVSNTGIHGYHETLGIDEDEIFFHWALKSTDENALQTAYRIVVCTDSNVESSGNQFWDSGVVNSNDQRNISCKPEGGFMSTCNYYWRVSVWDHKDEVAHSSINHFFTAYPRSRRLPPYSMNQTCKSKQHITVHSL